MAKTAAADASAPSGADAGPLGHYKASWIDRLMAAVQGLPAPYWLTYLLLGLAETVFIQCGQTTLYSWMRRPSAKRVRASDETSSVVAPPSRIISLSSRPAPGPCIKPWPEKPATT